MPSILLDAGPAIALFDRSDRHHKRALDFLKRNNKELHTTLPILGEILANLDFSVDAQIAVLKWIIDTVEVHESTEDLLRIAELMVKYRDMPADFGDASLVALAERKGISDVATIDKDFDVYSTKDKKRFRNVF